MKTSLFKFSLTPGRTATLGVLAACVLTVACRHLPPDERTPDAYAMVADRVEAYQAAWNTHDPSALSAFFAHDADMVMSNAPATSGQQAIRDWWSRYFAKIEPERRGKFSIDSTRLITPDVALVNVSSETGGRDSRGQVLSTRLARGTWVLVNESGEWFLSALRGQPAQGEPTRVAGEDAVPVD